MELGEVLRLKKEKIYRYEPHTPGTGGRYLYEKPSFSSSFVGVGGVSDYPRNEVIYHGFATDDKDALRCWCLVTNVDREKGWLAARDSKLVEEMDFVPNMEQFRIGTLYQILIPNSAKIGIYRTFQLETKLGTLTEGDVVLFLGHDLFYACGRPITVCKALYQDQVIWFSKSALELQAIK